MLRANVNISVMPRDVWKARGSQTRCDWLSPKDIVLEILEFYEHRITRYDPETGEGGLFADYMDTCLKLKAEASG